MAGREGADRHEASELISQSLPYATTPSLHFRPSLPRRGRASAAIIASRAVLFSAVAMATLFP
jgi:hypothetical protein